MKERQRHIKKERDRKSKWNIETNEYKEGDGERDIHTHIERESESKRKGCGTDYFTMKPKFKKNPV